MLKELHRFGITPHIMNVIKALYEIQKGIVHINNQCSKEFSIMWGVRQGCVISPHLFNVYREHIMWLALTDLDCGVSIAGQCTNELRYTDKTTLTA